MKNLFLFFATVFLLIDGSNFTANAQDNKYLYSEELQQAYANRTVEEKKISSSLFGQIFRFKKTLSGGNSITEAIKYFSSDFNFIDDQYRLLIKIRFKPNSSGTESVKEIITNSDGLFEKEEIGHNSCIEIYAWMSIEKIINITSIPDVAFIEMVNKPVYNYTTAGDVQLNAASVRSTMNVSGEWYDIGIPNKIGVMSDGVKSYLNGEIPPIELPIVNVLNPGYEDGDEGTAMLEIIHDIAPGAQLYFSSPHYSSLSTLAQQISELENYGCNIIVDDYYKYDEPFFSDESALGTAIKNFISNGNVYVTAAGNNRKRCLTGTTIFSNLFHIFPSGYDYYPITITRNTEDIILQWATSWTNPTEDLDLYIYDMSDQLVIKSDDVQSFTVPPWEGVTVLQGTYKVKIKRRNASDGVNFKVLALSTDYVSGLMTNQVFGHAG